MQVGKSFPKGPSPVFPPLRWVCPNELGGCGKEHGKPHYPFPGQIDYTKKPGIEGRIVFNRVKGDGELDTHMRIEKKYVDKQAEQYDYDGTPRPLFCPHCGFTLEGVLLLKVPA